MYEAIDLYKTQKTTETKKRNMWGSTWCWCWCRYVGDAAEAHTNIFVGVTGVVHSKVVSGLATQ